MDELDEPTHPPITLPRPKIDPIEIDSPARVADGTQTKLGAAPRAKATIPPPIPAAARAARGSIAAADGRKPRTATVPPPIPAAAMKPRGTTSSTTAAPPDNVAIDPVIAPPAPTLEPPATVTVAADIDVPIEHDESAISSLPLPPLPRPSQNWLTTTSQPPPPRTDEPRRRIAGASRIDLKPAPLGDDDDIDTPLPPPMPAADSGDEWPVLEPRGETSAVADLFAPVAPEPVPEPSVAKPAPEAPSSDVETSAKLDVKSDYDPDPERAADLFSLPPIEEPSTSYFERPPTYNRRHLAAVGAAAVVLAVLAAVVVRAAMKPPVKAMPIAAATPTPRPTPTPTPVAAAESPTPVAAAESPTPTPTPTLTIDVPITSTPSGATVTLISNGAPRVLGKTPLFAAVDPAQSYDVVVAMNGKPTAMQHLDPHATKQIAVAFDGAKPAVTTVAAAQPAPAPAPAPAPIVAATPSVQAAPPAEHHHHHSDARVAVAEPAPAPAPVAPPVKPSTHGSWNVAPAAKPVVASSASAAGGANGVLMVASKPPCEIVIDGKPTQLETPQRSIALSPGTHSVTLINAKLHINKTVPVQVAANKPTKLIRDFTGQ